MVSRAEAVKQYKKSKIKLKKELKDIKKLKNVLFSIAKKSGSRRDIKKIKKIDAKSSRKRCNSSSNSSSDELDSNSSLSSDSEWDTYRRSYGRKEMNRFDHVVIYNIKTNKDQLNEAI